MRIRDLCAQDYFTFRFPQEGWMDTFTIYRTEGMAEGEHIKIRPFESPAKTITVHLDLHVERVPDTCVIVLRYGSDYGMERPQWFRLTGLTLAQSIILAHLANGKSEFIPGRHENGKLFFVLYEPEIRNQVMAEVRQYLTLVPGYLLEEPHTYEQPRWPRPAK
ncbi:MAG: hypothetical protein GWN58_27920 [Anaerolineae bacterium]|nr:hypothetical protein [Anaerolineae bacterium]